MDPEALQQHDNYGIQAILDGENEALIAQLENISSRNGTFDEFAVVRLILYPNAGSMPLSIAQQSNVIRTQILRNAAQAEIGRDYADLVYDMCQLIVSTDGHAAVALGVSHDMLKRMKIATGGIDPDTWCMPEVAAVRAAREKLKTTRLRGASLSTLAAVVATDLVDLMPDYYRIFVGPQEPEGRVRDSDD